MALDINFTFTPADDSVGPDQLQDTAVTAGSYSNANITVDEQGRVTAAADGGASETVLILSQFGENAPTAVVKRSSSNVGTVTFAYVNTGIYRATPSILLDPEQAEILCGTTGGIITAAFVDFEDEPGTIYIHTKGASGSLDLQDGALFNTTLLIRP